MEPQADARLAGPRRASLRQLAVLIVVPCAVWFQTIFFGFVYHDDDKMIIHNAALLQDGFHIDTIFNTDAWLQKRKVELYRPLQTLTFIFDYAVWGLDPRGYHLHNLAIFLLDGLALFALLRRLFPRGDTAIWGAGLYQVNPLFSHAVAWLPARGDLYLFGFSLLCLIFLLDFVRERTAWRLVPCAAFFLLALLAKESAIVLLPIAGLILYQHRKRPLFTGAALASLAFVAAGLALYLKLRAAAVSPAALESSPEAWLRKSGAIFEEAAKFLVPVNYSVMPRADVVLALAGLVAVAWLCRAVVEKKSEIRRPIVHLGLALWLFPYLPALAYKTRFVGHAYDYLDHRAYFCLVGLWVVVAELWRAGAVPGRTSTLVAAGIGLYFSIASLLVAGTYHDWRPYYRNATTTNPSSFLAAYNRGLLLVNDGKYGEALAFLARAKQLLPEDPEVRTRLAGVLLQLGRFEEAGAEASFGITKQNADLADAHLFRGVALLNTARAAEALPDLRAAVALDRNDPQKWRFLGLCLKSTARLPEAVAALTRSLELMPNQAQAHFERAACHESLGRIADARRDLDAAIRLKPDYGAAWLMRGRMELALGERREACVDLVQARALNAAEAEHLLERACGNSTRGTSLP